jgi:hypothetical protein
MAPTLLTPLLFTSMILSESVSARPALEAALPKDPSAAITTPQAQERSLLRRGSRALFCLFDWDCEDDEEGLIGDFKFPCLGIFEDCEDDKNRTATAPKNSTATPKPTPTSPVLVNYTRCNNRTDGIFGGRPLFGGCGVLTEFVDSLFNTTDSNGDGVVDGVTIGNPTEADNVVTDEDLFLRLFPEGSLLWEIFNEEDDEEFVESVLGAFREVTDLFNNGFVDDWEKSVAFTNNTCPKNVTTAVVEPVCLNLRGGQGFWVCRTLYDPFSGVASNQSVCIDKGEYLAKNDQCGCCGASCPQSCPCKCNLSGSGGTNNGVLVTNYLFDTDISFGNRCVTPEFATAAVSRYGGNIECLDKCPVPAA